jgi:ABC-type Mn2+/Zn2+ transport system permease subunit/Mn-dependent DtxR family transcriptional regulator
MFVVSAANDFSWLSNVQNALIYYKMQIAACAMIGATLGVLGTFVVLRRMALIGDALSHAILPGVVIAFIVLGATVGHLDGMAGVWGLFLGALLAGLLTSVFIGWVSRHARAKEDSAIGVVFTAMFALGVVLISLQPKGTHFDLTCFLFGEALAIKKQDFVSIAIVTPLVFAYILLGYRSLKMLSFDPQMASAAGVKVELLHYVFMGFLAAAVVAALRTVGVIMSVAMLVTPAAAAYQLTNRLSVMLVLSALFGSLSAVVGFLVAFAFNIPTGPAMVLMATFFFALSVLLAPEYGVLGKYLRRRSVRQHILEEDVLKCLQKGDGTRSQSELSKFLSSEQPSALKRAIAALQKQAMLTLEGETLRLSEAGAERAQMLVRSHRLWESYLASHDMDASEVHPVAERLEHAHELAEEIALEMGQPETDPHGQPIPPRRDISTKS